VPSVISNGVAVAFLGRPLCFVLVAMTVLAGPGRRLARKTVAAGLWPEDDEIAAAANLRRHLSHLIAALPLSVGRDREAIWWSAEDLPWCDVIEFERGALDLYAGDFMEGFDHDWVRAERERLRGAAVDGFARRAESLREAEDIDAAIASARRAIEIDPIDESLAQLEIELHGERGDVPALDVAYQALRRRLEDVDARPSATTVDLVERFQALARTAAERLPRPITTYVGTAAVDEVGALIPRHRLVTIFGPGGVGKTRLAIEVASRIAPTFADGVYFVDLSALTEGDALGDALSRALGVTTSLASKGFEGVVRFLNHRRTLLILDNCEQISESCSWFVSDALGSAHQLRILATSRQAFGLTGERTYLLHSLSQEHAVRLFVERAGSASWDGTGIADLEERIAATCERLDRLPLAIELAASLLGTVSLADVEWQVDAGAGAIRSRDVTIAPRHRSLEGVISWSIDLLDEPKRRAFARLGVFPSSFSAAAAQAVCGVDVDTLGELARKSILVREDAGESRFVFLNSIAEYARRLFDADSDAAALRDAHAAWFATIAMRSEELTFWRTERAWLREIDRDFPSIDRALRWSLLEDGSRASGLRLAIGLAPYFSNRGYFADGFAWTKVARDRAAPGSAEHAMLNLKIAFFETPRGNYENALESSQRATVDFERLGLDRGLARALCSQGANLQFMRRFEEAGPPLERALLLARRSGDRKTESTILANLSIRISFSGTGSDADAARDLTVLALRCCEELGDDGGAALNLNHLAGFDYLAGRYAAANENLERALAIQRDRGDLYDVTRIICNLGDVAVMQEAFDRASGYYCAGLAHVERYDAERVYRQVLSGSAVLALTWGRARDGARLLGASESEKADFSAQARIISERARALAERALGAPELALELRAGRELSRADALRLARDVHSFGRSP
jgi:predicted ATPase/DNA-binding SARP family transcriptional activator